MIPALILYTIIEILCGIAIGIILTMMIIQSYADQDKKYQDELLLKKINQLIAQQKLSDEEAKEEVNE